MIWEFLSSLWNVVGLVILLVAVIEVGGDKARHVSRRLRSVSHPDFRATADAYEGVDWAKAYFDEFWRVEVAWAPYVQWWMRPFRGNFINIDDRGLRVTPGSVSGDPEAIRIFCFGGSTMMGVGARDEGTIPAFLHRALTDAGQRIEVTNFGQLGHTNTQGFLTLQRLLKAGEIPHIALFYDGVNELLSTESTGRAGALIGEDRRIAEFNLLHESRRGDLFKAAFLAAVPRIIRRIRRLTGLPLRNSIINPPAFAVDEKEIPPLAERIVGLYAENVRMIRALAGLYGFTPLFFWQPVLATKKQKSPSEERWEGHAIDNPQLRLHLHSTVQEIRAGHAGLNAAPDTRDIAAIFDDEPAPLYIDAFHLAEQGNARVCEAMAPAVLDAIAALPAGRRGDGTAPRNP